MNTISIEAIYQNGVLKPNVKLDIPENTPVSLTLSPLPTKSTASFPFGSLRGIWSEVQFPPYTTTAVPEMHDRSIALEARAHGAKLITHDQAISNAGVVATVW
ncbi:MAG TPA: antitoxin AF2212-like protein [Anaerolineales bacterium]|nr:antitoxin AF2212-like protein [Anaerolineales bacterium]HLB46902.1 antitoxin AF2212-like protein [Anaerolineales bacterium]